MTNVLIPTDFTANSLSWAAQAIKTEGCPKCNVILFHAFDLPSDPYDLLRGTAKDPAAEMMTEAFRQACKQLKDEHSDRIGKIIVRCMRGSTRWLFRNFVEANDVDMIYCPDNYVFVPIHSLSVNPTQLFKKCGVPVMKTIKKRTETLFENPFFQPVQVSTQ